MTEDMRMSPRRNPYAELSLAVQMAAYGGVRGILEATETCVRHRAALEEAVHTASMHRDATVGDEALRSWWAERVARWQAALDSTTEVPA